MYRKLLVTSVSSLLLGVLAAASAASAATPAIHFHVEGTGQAVNETTFVGTYTVTLDGVDYTVTVTVTAQSLTPLPSGDIHFVTTQLYEFSDGSTITATDRGWLSPTATPGLYTMHNNVNITGGTGAYAGANGHLHNTPGVPSTLNFATEPPEATVSNEGVLILP